MALVFSRRDAIPLSTFQASSIRLDAERFVTTQVICPSTDGVRVSMFLTHCKDIMLDSSNPLLLRYGTDAGHGTLTVNKVIDEESDYLAFLSATLR